MSHNDVYRVGDGPHAVLGLHGWFGAAESWRPLAPHLDGSRFSYYFLDYRGYGPRMGESEGRIGRDRHRRRTRPRALLGAWPLDGWQCHAAGARAGAGAGDLPRRGITGAGRRCPFDDDGWALFSGAAEEPGNRRAIIDLTTGNRLTDVWLDAAVQASLATSDKAAFGAYLGSWAKTDFHQQIEGNPVPVKVIVGEHDPALGEATMQATFVQWYPNCELEVLANAGQPLTRPVTHFS